jgi:asparagine synthase (glutamine-hydrolysing)
MPGIAGLITSRPRVEAEAELFRMVEALRHEPFYTTGTWIDETAGVYVGWAARQGSFAAEMPAVNETGDIVLAYAGEDYADPAAVAQLKARGHAFDTSRASYLVHLFEEDKSFPECLNGRFHGLLTDRGQGTAMLFNDRYGMQRIYFHESKDSFYFAAEAKALLSVLPHLRKADWRGLGEYVTCGTVLENRTLFEGISLLPPASTWTFRNRVLEKKSTYFDRSTWEDQAQLDEETYYRQLKSVFARVLPRYFEGPERVAMSLTGGLDSRMILAWRRPEPGALPCYSFGGMYRDCEDVALARLIAGACGQQHQTIPVGREFLSRFAHYAERTVYLTDGSMEVTHSPDLYVNEIARHIGSARVTGNYGGEVLRRVRAFKPVEHEPGLFTPDFSRYFAMAREVYARQIQLHPLSFALFAQAPWHHYNLLSLEQTQLQIRSPYLDNEFVQTVYLAPQSALTSNDISLRLIADGDMKLRQIRTDRGLGGENGTLARALLNGWLEFTFKAEYAYDYGMPDSVARVDHVFKALHLERLFLGRHKFYHFRIWYRDPLAAYVKEMLLDRRSLSRPYIEPRQLETMVQAHVKGNRNYTTEIHKLLTLELFHRLFVDSQ